ncbi:MAG: outer membrane protein assembly factor BamE [Proteobacteria bacterium]|nr:outer membrane protein assembly factor BamE [Pseudomonadota bacterium]
MPTRSLARFALPVLFALALAACGSKVTPENYERIKDGMSQEEVTAILGPPAETSSLTILGISGTSSSWTGGDLTVTIQFVDGKVRIKSMGKAAAK